MDRTDRKAPLPEALRKYLRNVNLSDRGAAFGMLEDSVIGAAMVLIGHQVAWELGGLCDTNLSMKLSGERLGFAQSTRCPHIQIHHLGTKRHWVASCRLAPNEPVWLLDSFQSLSQNGKRYVIPDSLKQQLIEIYGENAAVRMKAVMQQKDQVSCGVFAIVFAWRVARGWTLQRVASTPVDATAARFEICEALSQKRYLDFPRQ